MEIKGTQYFLPDGHTRPFRTDVNDELKEK